MICRDNCEFMVFVCVSVMIRNVVATAPEIQNAKAMLALGGEMSDDAIARNLRLVHISLETDVACGVVCVPFRGIGLQLFVSGARFLRGPCTTGQLVGRIGDDTF